jgi:DNA-binding transcriptional MocR family regulator
MDRPGYVGAIQTFRAAGARIAGWDVTRGDLEECEDLILRYRPKFLYLTPTFHNPTGRTLSIHARRDLLALAERYRLPVVEDDPYRDLWFDRPPPPTLAALDSRGLVIHVGTFSKTLASGLRLGWLAASPAIIEQLALIKQRSDASSNTLAQVVATEFLTSGLFDAHVARLRIEHARRHDTMLSALAGDVPPGLVTCRPADGGLYLWCRLGRGLDAARVAAEAERCGVVVATGTMFYADGAGADHLRLCFTTAPPEALAEGVRRLGRVLRGLAKQPLKPDLVALE